MTQPTKKIEKGKFVPVFLRTHTVAKLRYRKPPNSQPFRYHNPKWATYALGIDCETTLDTIQDLTFGSARFCRRDRKTRQYICIKEIFFYRDDLPETDPEGLARLRAYVATHNAEVPEGCPPLQLMSRSEFMKREFWPAMLDAKAMAVFFNAPFDISRLAIDCTPARKKGEGWSFITLQDIDPKTGLTRENIFYPRIKVTPRDSKSAFIRLTGVGIKNKSGKRIRAYVPGRILDLKTLGWALRNESYSLKSACKEFQGIEKAEHTPTGQITFEEIEYCRQDLRATVSLLNAMAADFDRHPIDLLPDRAFSPASIVKSYLRGMNIARPSEKFDVPDYIQGIAMQGYFGGRAECRIRLTEVPIVHTDLTSEYPTANTNMRLWELLSADKLIIEDATEDVKSMLQHLEAQTIYDKEFWPQLRFFALVKPNGDIFPTRAPYNLRNTNIGINPFSAHEPVWFAGPDIVAAKLLTGRTPEIIKAIRISPEGQQPGMKPIRLRGEVEIDPYTQDFFKRVIEQRGEAKEKGLEGLASSLKVTGAAGSYGLFVEVNTKELPEGERVCVHIYSGEIEFPTTSEIVEEPGKWYFPLFGSLITAAGRLMLALIEHAVAKRGGTYLFCDTDSLAIVANENGGLIPCRGGPYKMADGRAAVRALSWKQVEEIQEEMNRLNPYEINDLTKSILKIEKINYLNGVQRQLYGVAIAAKRYVIYAKTENGREIVSAKAHGLGFLLSPTKGFNESLKVAQWVIDAWQWILGELFGENPPVPVWFDLPAMMRCTITTREVLKTLQAAQAHLPYHLRSGKPLNFCLIPILDELDGRPVDFEEDKFSLITPYETDSSKWFEQPYFNIHELGNTKGKKPKTYRLSRAEERLSSDAVAVTYGDFVKRYRWHPEAKSSGPDGEPCGPRTQGLLSRTPVFATNFELIGKETDRRWEHGEDISLLESEVVRYRPHETKNLVVDQELQQELLKHSIRTVAREAEVSKNTVKRAIRGERLQKRVISQLRGAVKELGASKERRV